MKWNQVSIVGVGLIGGAIGLGLLKRKLCREVVGIGRQAASLETAQRVGAISSFTLDLAAGVQDADLVVICTPVGQIVDRVCQAAAACRAGALITDAGSTKEKIVAELSAARNSPAWPREVRFVGSHPLAGNEKRGPEHAQADLFQNRVVVVTPDELTRAEDCRRIREFWSDLGARVVEMSAAEHDRALAVTSHLPHLISSAIAGATPEEYVTLTAGGWLDTTRIAAGDPQLWQQIMLSNRENLLAALDRFEGTLAALRRALADGHATQLEQLLAEAKNIRDAVGS